MRRSLAFRVLAATVIVFAVPLLVYFLIVFHRGTVARRAEVLSQLEALGESRVILLEQAKRFSLRMLRVVEKNPELFSSVTKEGDFASLFFDEERVEEGTYLGIDEKDNKLFYVAVKVEGTPPMALVISTPIEHLLQYLSAAGEVPYRVDFSLIDRTGVIFASSDPALIAEERTEAALTVRVPVEGAPFSLQVDVPERLALGAPYKRLWHILIIFFSILIVTVGFASWITYHMAKPLKKLREVMGRVSEGELGARYEKEKLGFEINEIGTTFNETLSSLSNYMVRHEQERVEREMLSRELAIGRDIQKAILPHERPTFPGVEIATRYVPAKEVSGDFYDLFSMGKDLLITVADGSGKGISACLYSLSLRAMLRQASVALKDHERVIKEANNLFCQDTKESGMFVTAFVAIYHSETSTLTYSSLGHTPSYLFRKSGEVEVLDEGGMAMGMAPMDHLDSASVALNPGDTLVLYSDGVTEAHNRKHELYGEERLLKSLKSHASESPDTLADHVLTDLSHFQGDAPQFDDITLMVLRF